MWLHISAFSQGFSRKRKRKLRQININTKSQTAEKIVTICGESLLWFMAFLPSRQYTEINSK